MVLSTQTLITCLCLAGDFQLMPRTLEAHTSKVSAIDAPKGKSTLTVEPEAVGTVISCRLINGDNEVSEQKYVRKCSYFLTLADSDVLSLKVTNETDHQIVFGATLKASK